MSGSWRDISRIIGVILALSLIAWNLYTGTDIAKALFRGVTAYLVYTIVNIIFTTIVYKVVNEFELKRLEELNQLGDEYEYDEDEEGFERQPATEGATE